MESQLMYKKLAKYYDLIYSAKNYKKEAEIIKRLIGKYKRTKGKHLLEIACGTGGHLKYLKNNFSCLGTDISEEMLKIARKNVRGVSFRRADMIRLRLKRRFDIIICLFSSIGYVNTLNNLKKTIHNFADHLKSGGVVIIEPWFAKSACKDGSPHMTIYDGDSVKIARLAISKARNNISVVDMHYMFAERNKKVAHFVDRHELGMFEESRILSYMEKSGFKAKFQKRGLMRGKGLIIGIKK